MTDFVVLSGYNPGFIHRKHKKWVMLCGRRLFESETGNAWTVDRQTIFMPITSSQNQRILSSRRISRMERRCAIGVTKQSTSVSVQQGSGLVEGRSVKRWSARCWSKRTRSEGSRRQTPLSSVWCGSVSAVCAEPVLGEEGRPPWGDHYVFLGREAYYGFLARKAQGITGFWAERRKCPP